MRAKESQINEIGYADTLSDLSMPHGEIISKSSVIGRVDGKNVHHYQQGSSDVYFFETSNNIDAIVLLDGASIKGIKNYSGIPGLATALVGFIVHDRKITIEINHDEPLTTEGFKWLVKLLTNKRNKFTITDQTGNFPDVSTLEKEWIENKNNDTAGETTIYISENNLTTAKLKEGARLLMHTTIWVGNRELV